MSSTTWGKSVIYYADTKTIQRLISLDQRGVKYAEETDNYKVASLDSDRYHILYRQDLCEGDIVKAFWLVVLEGLAEPVAITTLTLLSSWKEIKKSFYKIEEESSCHASS